LAEIKGFARWDYCGIMLLHPSWTVSELLPRMGDMLTRRGAAEATQLTHVLAAAVDSVRGALCKHMRREELEVLPLLQAHLCDAEQRSMVWRMLRAMPLRLLTRVMPVVAGMRCCGRVRTVFDSACPAHI
jgi:hypothetical protein